MKKLRTDFAMALPLLACAGSLTLWVAVAVLGFLSAKHAANGAQTVKFAGPSITFEIPSQSIPRFAVMASAMKLDSTISALNAPAHFVDLAIAYAFSRKPFWSPDALGPAAWHCLTYPFFAIPAWFFIGRGLDALLRRQRVPVSHVLVSAILASSFGVMGLVLFFGLADDPGLVPGLKVGIPLWAFLFAVPFASWLKQRKARRSDVQETEYGSVSD